VVKRCFDCVIQKRDEAGRHLVLQALAGLNGRIRRTRRAGRDAASSESAASNWANVTKALAGVVAASVYGEADTMGSMPVT
jgi:hypothetical protein